jgi:selenocysteine-specific elongation factor
MFVVGTAGHIDHGKSALVQKMTGIDPDRLPEEKARGMTIDLGFAWAELPSGRAIGIVDVPGHERFVKNMVAGVGGIDADRRTFPDYKSSGRENRCCGIDQKRPRR